MGSRDWTSFSVIYSWFLHLIFMSFLFFSPALSGYGTKFAASEVAGARNQVSAPVSPVDEGKR